MLKYSHFVASVCKKLISVLPEDYLSVSAENICLAALFHDLGKAGWSEHWFYRFRCELDDKELQMMNEHPELGAKMLDNNVVMQITAEFPPIEIIKAIASSANASHVKAEKAVANIGKNKGGMP